MSQIKEGTLLWEPDKKWKQKTNIQAYMEWLNNNKNLQFYDYHSLWKWSVNELEAFWESQWEYFDIQSTKTYTSVLSTHKMPGAKWFDGAEINYSEHIFRNRKTDKPAIIHASEIRETSEITWNELYKQTAAMQKTLKNLGVQKGDH